VYVHGHCHHKSILKMDDEWSVLKKAAPDYHEIESGCCGMAGAFGYEAGDHYDVSIACGERALLPAVRNAEPDALIVSDGFSCREQIQQETDRRAMHLSQLLRMGLPHRAPEAERPSSGGLGWAIVAGVAACAASYWLGRRKYAA